MYVDRRNTGSYRSLDSGASGQDLASRRSSQRKGHLGWGLEVAKQEYKEGCSQQREQNMQREEREYIQGTENCSLSVEWTIVETMESEACKGDVTEVGLEKHTGLDIRGPRQPWAGHCRICHTVSYHRYWLKFPQLPWDSPGRHSFGLFTFSLLFRVIYIGPNVYLLRFH